MANEAISAAAQRVVTAVSQGTPDVQEKWPAIQDNLGTMPPDSLKDLIVDLTRSLVAPSGTPLVTDQVVMVIEDRYRRALFAAAQRRDPEDPVLTPEQWKQLPDRWFDSPPTLKPVV